MELLKTIKELTKDIAFYDASVYQKAIKIDDLPIINKDDIVNNYHDLTNYSREERISYQYTSGSTGTSLTIPWRPRDYHSSMMTLWRLRKKYGISPNDFYLTCHANSFWMNNSVRERVIVNLNNISVSKLCYSNENMELYSKYIRELSPKWIYGQPSFVYFLGAYLATYHSDLARIFSYVELVGELLLPEIKKQIESFFPCATVINMYGMQEVNGIMYEDDGVLYSIDNNVYVELLNNDGERCSVGEEGDIVITGLKNTAFPLVRYRTGDKAILTEKDGRIGYVITQGRANDSITIEGKIYDGSIFFAIVNEYNMKNAMCGTITKFQVIYQNSEFIFRLFSFDGFSNLENVRKKLQKIFLEFIGIMPNLVVESVGADNFIYSESQKIKYFINKNKEA